MEKKAHSQSRVLLLSKNQKSTMCAIKVCELEIATVSQSKTKGKKVKVSDFSRTHYVPDRRGIVLNIKKY